MLDVINSLNNDILLFFNHLPGEIHVAAYLIGLSIYPMILCVVYLAYQENRMGGLNAFLSLAGAYIASLILKYLFHVPRPYDTLENLIIIQQESSHSFPSSHATVAFDASETSIRYTTILRSWAVTIALSRVVLGVHYISDVIAGAFLGILVSHLFARWDVGRFIAKFKKS